MRKVIALTVVILLSIGVVGVYAADAPQDVQSKGSWCKKDGERHVFQDPANAINKWHTTVSTSKQMSLRGNSSKIKQRRQGRVVRFNQ